MALEILLRVERDRAFADVLLGRRLDSFAPVDRRFITQLVLGTIAWQGRLDFELSRLSTRALDLLAPEILAILRMGLFQIRILSRIPPHAVVNTAVSLARTGGLGHAAGFVNAVLRSALRASVPLPDEAVDPLEYLAVAHSHPRWLVEKFVEWFGLTEAKTLMEANNRPAPNVLRLNLARAPVDDLVAGIERDGMIVAGRGRFPETVILGSAPVLDCESWREGRSQLQSEASQLIARLLAPSVGAIVVDCAAAPGGKATHLAELTGPAGRVIGLDLNFAGLRNAGTVAGRLRHSNLSFARADTSVALPIRAGSVNFVLLDAPCSGLGTLREHPEIRWRLTPADLDRMALLQARMLARAAELVRIGGVLVYAVCSVAPLEGPELVRAFVAANPAFEIDCNPPAAGELEGLLEADGTMRTRPDRGGLDGFFAARLKRRA
ncbi:MAG TPA: 16S rRNA (cytosine(967)-C(5))-methyltransferase RsmB [Candidatus Binataceae bacterium]|nr:16S rRNA (cytosine(967)-C(5))-methyltransferase RsmB [Candidatus Binataceae bacterium]